jgi:DEAD/DEAH box helicase domain-containing protein
VRDPPVPIDEEPVVFRVEDGAADVVAGESASVLERLPEGDDHDLCPVALGAGEDVNAHVSGSRRKGLDARLLDVFDVAVDLVGAGPTAPPARDHGGERTSRADYALHGQDGRVAVELAPWNTLLVGDELAYVGSEAARDARLAPLPDDLHPRLGEALEAQGVQALYEHQAAAWEAARRGEHLIITTGTASGKTLAFNLPVLDAIAREPKQRALYLYPTKALAQDQLRALGSFRLPKLRAAIYDGDTATDKRWQVRKWANLILSNPDMLHVGVLPHHDRWGDVLSNLAYVIVDEAHVYRGVFGSHVANVLRRLRRLARVYGAEPQFLLASATIANPGELGSRLLGAETTVIGDDAAPRAERTVALWNPPLTDEELGLRASPLGEASRLMAELVSRKLRTLCFAKSRRAAELIHRFTADRLGDNSQLSPYRAGYTPAQRREVERRLLEGELLGVSATNALELGIDIGLLDCVISVGFPGTVASLRQQWGRAGRRGHGLAVLVASEDALDQYFMREPRALLGRRVEAAILDHENPRVLDGHVRAAAFEAPVDNADRDLLGEEALERAAALPELRKTDAGYVWAGRDYPAARVSLRSTSPEAFSIVEGSTGTLLGLSEESRAYSTVHEGAIYLHLGESYRVQVLDLEARTAVVKRFSGDYYTQAKKETTTAIVEPMRHEVRLGVPLSFGRVVVTEQVVGYQRKSIQTQEQIDLVALDLPQTEFETEAIWFLPEPPMLDGLMEMTRLLGSLHAAEHSLIALLPLWAMCDRWDIGGLSTNLHFQTGRPTIFVYDGHAGGVGITERGFEAFEGWVEDTAKLLVGCPCERGCPSCVQSPKCGNLNEPLDKAGALTLLRRMLDA